VSVEQHKGYAPAKGDLRVAVITASDSRTLENDEGGGLVQALAEQAGFGVASRQVLREEPAVIRAAVAALISDGTTDAVLLTGGTGLAGRDSTIEAVAPLLEKALPGFGELFRMLSFAEIGSAAMMSRAFAGSARGTAVFAMPGSPAGVRLAMARLIIPELPHVVGQLRRDREPGSHPGRDHRHE
jgi:molybdenum cofactor biosynthesis protein B